ncbi:Uncharacterised protein [Escherichia coli]|nr:Uncharacterised protein [Escherichia coli]
MWTAWRSMPPCWKNSRLSLNTFGKPKAGNGAPDAWSLSVSAVKIPGHTATCRSRKRLLTEAEEERLNELMIALRRAGKPV